MTNEEVLAQSTAAAKKAAETIGGTYTQGTYNSSGNVQGGFTPTNILDIGTLGNNPPVEFPPQGTTDYSTGLGNVGETDISTLQNKAIDTNTQNQANILKQFQDMLGAPPSSADAYLEAQKQTGILEKQQKVTDLTATLDTIVNRGREAQLTLESQAGGRDITSSFLGRQQQEIARQTAIQSLPVSAQLNAAQGNLTMAQSNLDTLFKMYSDDATNAYNYRKDVATAFKEVATSAENKKLDLYLTGLQNQYNEQQALLKTGQSYAEMAFKNGQSDLGAKIMGLDIKSPTYKEDMTNLIKNIKDPVMKLDIELKKAQLLKVQQENALFEKYGGLTPTEYNKQIEAEAKASQNASEDSILMKTSIDQIDAILNSSALDSVVGSNPFARGITRQKGFFTGLLSTITSAGLSGTGAEISGKADDTVALTQQMLDQQFLDKLIAVKSKGATFGALSDNEGMALRNAANAIASTAIKTGSASKGDLKVIGYDMSEKEFKKQMTIIQDTIKRARERATGEIFDSDEQNILDNAFGPGNTNFDISSYY